MIRESEEILLLNENNKQKIINVLICETDNSIVSLVHQTEEKMETFFFISK